MDSDFGRADCHRLPGSKCAFSVSRGLMESRTPAPLVRPQRLEETAVVRFQLAVDQPEEADFGE